MASTGRETGLRCERTDGTDIVQREGDITAPFNRDGNPDDQGENADEKAGQGDHLRAPQHVLSELLPVAMLTSTRESKAQPTGCRAPRSSRRASTLQQSQEE